MGHAVVPCDERAKTYRRGSPLPRGEESEVRGFRLTYEGVFPSSCPSPRGRRDLRVSGLGFSCFLARSVTGRGTEEATLTSSGSLFPTVFGGEETTVRRNLH